MIVFVLNIIFIYYFINIRYLSFEMYILFYVLV